MDGGRWQGKEEDPVTKGRWREHKVCTVVKYAPGDGKEKKPEPLVASVVATTADAWEFGPLCRLEAEKRGLREADQVLVIADGGNWIDPLLQRTLEAGVKQFNKRIKGTEQFWREQQSLEPILALRGMWLSQDQRWDRYWATRSSYARKVA